MKIFNSVLARKLQFTLFIIFLLRVGTYIPVPHIDQRYLNNMLNSSFLFQIINNTNNPRLGIFSVGIIPYINASIIVQLLTGLIPKLEKLQKEEGEKGRKQIKQYTRLLTFGFAVQQSVNIALSTRLTLFNWNLEIATDIILALTTGAILVLWLSEQITERGIGNGPSLVIATSIISSLPNPRNVTDLLNVETDIRILGLVVIIAGIVFVQEAIRQIPLISAKQLFSQPEKQKNKIYLPLRINQGGVMPLIFASAVISFVISGLNYLSKVSSVPLYKLGLNSVILITLKFGLIFGFTFFYSTLIINPKELAKNLNKMAVSIPNIRPGIQTEKFLNITLKRLSTLGAAFLATLVALPNIQATANVGITSFLILISVIIETDRQILTLLINKNYTTKI